MVQFNPQDHTYTIDDVQYPSVTQILADLGFYGSAAAYFTEYGRDRGRLVHKIVEYHCKGVLEESSIDPALKGYFEAWLLFEKDTGFISIDCEVPLVSPEYGFAGTPDHVGILNNSNSVIDVKTGAVFPATGIQLAGYEILRDQHLKRYGLQLKQNGKYSLKPFKDRSDRGTFLSALSVFQWKRNNVK